MISTRTTGCRIAPCLLAIVCVAQASLGEAVRELTAQVNGVELSALFPDTLEYGDMIEAKIEFVVRSDAHKSDLPNWSVTDSLVLQLDLVASRMEIVVQCSECEIWRGDSIHCLWHVTFDPTSVWSYRRPEGEVPKFRSIEGGTYGLNLTLGWPAKWGIDYAEWKFFEKFGTIFTLPGPEEIFTDTVIFEMGVRRMIGVAFDTVVIDSIPFEIKEGFLTCYLLRINGLPYQSGGGVPRKDAYYFPLEILEFESDTALVQFSLTVLQSSDGCIEPLDMIGWGRSGAFYKTWEMLVVKE